MANEKEEAVTMSPAFANALGAMGGLIDTNEIIEEGKKTGVVEDVKPGSAQQPAKQKQEAAPQQQDDAGEEGEEEVEENEEVEDSPADADKNKKPAVDEKPNPFFGKKKPNAAAAVTFENLEQVGEFAKKKFGIEVKDIKDLSKVFASSEKWRADATKFVEVNKKVEQYEKLIQQLPEPIVDAMQAFATGQNWEEAIKNKPSFDFSKPVAKQDTKALVNHYYPGKFTDEDFEGDPSPALEIAIDASKKEFQSDKTAWDGQRAKYVKDAQDREGARKASVTGSVTSLKQSFPDLDDSAESDIRTIMEGGDIQSLFLNSDGTYKPEAAELLMFAKYGKVAMATMMEQAANQAETRVNEDILTRGQNRPKSTKGGAEKPNEKVQKQISELTGGLNRKFTY